MKSISALLLATLCILAGCNAANSSRPDYFAKRATVVGSNVPIKPGQLTYSPTAATAPRESIARDAPSLYPTEPVVGRTDRGRDQGTRAVNVGAGAPGSNPVPGPTPTPGRE